MISNSDLEIVLDNFKNFEICESHKSDDCRVCELIKTNNCI
jgi:hypothetical protein